jgi:glycosyltransferase involved in cell wall biosynthesis
MPLTVLSVAFPFAPVSPEAVGGAEKILSDLDQALVASGNNSLVVACDGSRPSGTLFSVPSPRCEVLEEADKRWCRYQVQAAIERAMASRRVDLIHMHGLDFCEYDLPATIPMVVTLHLPVSWYRPGIWSKYASRAQFCCVSESQRRSCPPELNSCCVIENGVTLPPARRPKPKEDFALVIGRICPEKNAHAALEAGTRAGTQVVLAGQAFPYREHRRYLQEIIEPVLHDKRADVRHTYVGPLSSPQKQDLLAQAKCLLHPTLAPETSSLVAMEALAAGTPVIAYRSGALPEIVEPGLTGFLVDDVDEMAEAIRHVRKLSPQACRDAAERRFSKERMVQRYFELYNSLLQRKVHESRYA